MLVKESVTGDECKLHVTFALPASIWADTIYLVGDFNNWNTHKTPLQLDGDNWSVTLKLDTNQVYQYRYLVNDNEWMSDWNVDGSVEQAGITTSIVVTQLPAERYPMQPRDTDVIEPAPLRLPSPLSPTALPQTRTR
ncbi:MAG: isoamylase early set domain-containing protein [Chloroflexaceae bacterium]